MNAPAAGRIQLGRKESVRTRPEQTRARLVSASRTAPVEYPQGQIPLTRGASGTADQVAELILFLVSNRSSHITGTPVFIDGGQSLIA